jgi:TRAP-type C4-dicarboxylate transport system substrate-binding protein
MSRSRLAAFVLAAVAGAVMAGCSGGGAGADKAGGSGAPVVLRMADGYNPGLDLEPAVAYFVRRVRELSKGKLRVHVVEDWGHESPGFEQQIVRAVAAGKTDLGWVGTRAFDTLGVRSFQALTAPMLIDNYALERAVIASDIPARMLGGLDRLGVTGLGLLAGGLRKPIAVNRPLLRASDWRGIRFAVFRSGGQMAAIRALGARPTNIWGAALQDAVAKGRVDGFEKNYFLWSLVIDPSVVPYVAANVNLWPETAVLLANPHRLSALTGEQRDWLRRAATDAAARSTSLFEREAPLLRSLCKQGARFSNASSADLASFRRTLEPVYAALEQDPQTKAFIGRIEELKRATRPGRAVVIPPRCAGPAFNPSRAAGERTDPSVLNGVYRVSWTQKELRAAGPIAAYARTSYGVITLTLRDGRYRFRAQTAPECGGRYTVSGTRVRFRVEPAATYCQGVVAARWSLRNGDLRLRVVGATDPGDRLIWGGKPWKKIG